MSQALQEKRSRILKRLGHTLDTTIQILSSINIAMEKVVSDGAGAEGMADAYEIWERKVGTSQ
jgi:hypothetical protein